MGILVKVELAEKVAQESSDVGGGGKSWCDGDTISCDLIYALVCQHFQHEHFFLMLFAGLL